MNFNHSEFINVNTQANTVDLKEEPILRVIKAKKLAKPDENTFTKLANCNFHNGIIEVQVLSRLLPDAPDYARGFIGIAFRINEDNSAFESFYIRPTNGHTKDPIRKRHAVQYFSYPHHTFKYFRDNKITKYENSADIGLNQWITIKAEIKDETGKFYLNNNSNPILKVSSLKHGSKAQGSVGLFVDIGTEGFFKNLKIISTD